MANEFRKAVSDWVWKVRDSSRIKFPECKPSIDDLKYFEGSLASLDEGLSLELTNIKLTEATAKYLRNIFKQRKIQSLKIGCNNEDDLKILKELSGINFSVLILSFSVIPDIKQFIEIVKVSNIKKLYLSLCSIRDEDCILIINELKNNLLYLHLGTNEISNESTIIDLLEDDKISSIQFEDYRIEFNYKSFELKHRLEMSLAYYKSTNESHCNIIKSVTNRHQVEIRVYVNDDVAPFLSYALKKKAGMHTESVLQLKNVIFDLRNLYLIETVEFHCLSMDGSNLTDDVLEIFIKDLKYLKINKLSMNDCSISNEGIDKLFQILPETQIHTLNIGNNLFNHIGIQTIVQNLNNTNIKCLRLRSNDIGRAGVESIINFIPNSNLIELDLSKLSMDDEMLSLLCEAIKASKIIELNLSGNNFTPAGIDTLAKILSNTKLVSIDLRDSSLNDKCLLSIMNNAVKGKLCKIYVDYGQISAETEESIVNILKNYYLLTHITYLDADSSIPKRLHNYINRNRKMIQSAANIIKKFQDGTLTFNPDAKSDFLIFILVADHYYLWSDIANADDIKSEILNKINTKYIQ